MPPINSRIGNADFAKTRADISIIIKYKSDMAY
jgi:hypothetical protein